MAGAVALVALIGVTAGAQGRIAVSVSDRALQPGELVVVDLRVPGQPESVTVSLFGRDTTAYESERGRWRALVGIDLDQAPGSYVLRATAGGAEGRLPIAVRPKQFPTRRLSVDPDFVNPPPEAQARIAKDSAFLREVYAHSAPRRLWSDPFVRPVPGRANSRFGTRSVFNGQPRSPHGGADFLSGAGVPVKAPNAGRVVAARDLYYPGNVVIIDHGLGVFSMLAHLSRIDVREGETVAAGDIVGLVGATGRVTGPHLHWSFSVNGARVDPLSALALLGRTPPAGAARANGG
jgi:murein DD-endopeptidase MepM/ murein hydrolase activator NlpD